MEIIVEDYHYRCADGCCDEYKTFIIVDGQQIEAPWGTTREFMQEIVDALHIGAKVTGKYTDNDCYMRDDYYIQDDNEDEISDEEFNQETSAKIKDLFGDLFKKNDD